MGSKNGQMNTSRNAWVLLSFLECYHREGIEFLDHIITGDETWVSHYAPESKRQSQEWHQAHSLTKTTKIQENTFNCKNHGQRFLGLERHSFD
jgi:hypothetical protein